MPAQPEVFKKSRKANRVTLRQISEYVGKSIGYLSDIEHDRKRPPKLDTVVKIEEILKIKDQRLLKLADMLRKKIPDEVKQQFRMTPRLSEMLLRADEDLTNEEFDEMLEHLKEIKKRREK